MVVSGVFVVLVLGVVGEESISVCGGVLVFVSVGVSSGMVWVTGRTLGRKFTNLRAPSVGGLLADQGGVPQPASSVWEHRRERPMALMSP